MPAEPAFVPCPTCEGQGWMMQPEHDGEMCPDCQNPLILGGTGLVGGALFAGLESQMRDD